MKKANSKSAKSPPAPPPKDRVGQVRTLWKSLVESAFDFFEQAVKEHATSPKYAILHLAASVELFLKARLMSEHWTLIVSPKKTPTFDELRTGDFVSVTSTEAIERICGVLPAAEAVSRDAAKEFGQLAIQRNKIAHFFHSELDSEVDPHEIVQRQCRVWLHLHRLLTDVWKVEFSGFATRLNALDRTMREERKFLATVFEDSTTDLEQRRKAGHPIVKCHSCGFQSLVLQDSEAITHGHCVVCRYQSSLAQVECPDCKSTVVVESGYSHCPGCKHSFTPHELGTLIGGTLPEDDTGYSRLPINCSECETDEVYIVNGRYRCLNCMEEWDEISQCQWCNEYNTGDMDQSYIEGCSMCDGMSGWKGDRD